MYNKIIKHLGGHVLYNENSFSKKIFIIFLIGLILITNINIVNAQENIQGKKAIVLILDEVSIHNILDSKAENLHYLIDNGGIALMNTRAKSAVANRGSTYLSLGMGVRTLASTQAGLAFNLNSSVALTELLASEDNDSTSIYNLFTNTKSADEEVANLAIEDIRRTALDITPNNTVGNFGEIAKNNNLSIGFIGNADFITPNREATMIAMDNMGLIPYGNVDSSLLKKDEKVLGGIKLDEKKVLEEVDRILPKSDILFLDYGDTVRVSKSDRLASDNVRLSQKLKAIKRADFVLGELMKKVDLDETLFMVISPNPSKEMVSAGNFGLTPVILSSANTEKGLLKSNLTRRDGLVTNFDFSATILNHFDIKNNKELSGESMTLTPNENSIEDLINSQDGYVYIRKFRNAFHWSFIALSLVALAALFIPKFLKKKFISEKLLKLGVLTILTIPLSMLTVAIFGYKSIILDIAYVFLSSFIFSNIIYSLTKKDFILSLGIITAITSIFILLDGFIFNKYMIVSPLGSDAIAGGRFYGIGNDYMGILIGSTVLSFFSIFSKLKLSKVKMFIIFNLYMLFVVVALSPISGANMGGTISALALMLFSFFIIFEKKLSLKKLILLGGSVVIFILLVAGFDAMFNPNPTHAGKAILALTTGGSSKLIEIIRTKLGQVFYNLLHSPWNLVLFSELILLALLSKFKKIDINKLRVKYPIVFKSFTLIFIDALIIFMFNDTGTIAAAMIMLFALLPMGVLYNEK